MTKKDQKFLGVLKKTDIENGGKRASEFLCVCITQMFVCYKIKDYSEKVSESDLAITAVKHE